MKQKMIASLLCLSMVASIGAFSVMDNTKVSSEVSKQNEIVTPREHEVKTNKKEVKQKKKKEVEYISLGEFCITAYCSCTECCGQYGYDRPYDENGNPIVYTSIGAVAEPHHTISVDPSVIPYGTEVYIDGDLYVAEDCGGGIVGNHIDMYFASHEETEEYGVQYKELFIKKEE